MNLQFESAVDRKRRLYQLICRQAHGKEVIDELLPNGQPHEVEIQLWDYKEELPTAPTNVKLNDSLREQIDYKYSTIIKDAIAFFNSYGGYLLIGVTDKPREVVGYSQHFDCDELNKRIRGATNCSIECHYSLHQVTSGLQQFRIGLLMIPQRPDESRPAQFLKDGPPSATGKREFQKNSILFRDGHECRPAISSEDFHFLCSQNRRTFSKPLEQARKNSILGSNIGSRDPSMIRFVGRSEFLAKLWHWLCDRYVPVKLLAGLGGVGKTTLAREFAEEVIAASPLGFERVIWLSAKKRFFVAQNNEFIDSYRVDFTDEKSLLISLLLELGLNENELEDETSIEQLAEKCAEALKIIPSLVIIDDVDTLADTEQTELFHLAIRIATQTDSNNNAPSKILLTARLSLGAAAGQLMRIKGLGLSEFSEYIKMTAQALDIPESTLKAKSDLEQLWKVTEGSPTFASSILRLVDLGQPLKQALEQWKHHDGEDVRDFAFKKELEHLLESQARVLYALCLLGESSFAELENVTQSTERRLQEDLAELRSYHLVSHAMESAAGARLRIPEAIRMMGKIISGRFKDPRVVEKRVEASRKGAPDTSARQAIWIHRVLALWKQTRHEDALNEAKQAVKKYPNGADLHCLLGRAYLLITPPDARNADRAFSEATRLGCQRSELYGLQIEAKRLLNDWRGMINLTQTTDTRLTPDFVYIRGEAFGAIAEQSINNGNLAEAADYYFQAGKEINQAFDKKKITGRELELREMRARFLGTYVAIREKLCPHQKQHLEVFEAMIEAFRLHHRSDGTIRLGLNRLQSWWTSIEEREHYDEGATRKMRHQLRNLDEIINILDATPIKLASLILECRKTSQLLAERLDGYRFRFTEG